MSVKIKQRTLRVKTWRQLRSGVRRRRSRRSAVKKAALSANCKLSRRLRWENIEMAAMAVADNEVESDDENVSSMPIYMIGDQV